MIRDRKGEHQGILEEIRRQGFVRVRVDGNVHDVDEALALKLAKTKKHTIEVVVDRLVIRHDAGTSPDEHPDRVRVIESLETALKIADGIAEAQIVDGESISFSENFACPVHGVVGLTEIEPRNFSFNSPHGACPDCTGLGTTREFDAELIIPNKSLSLAQGAIVPWLRATGEGERLVRGPAGRGRRQVRLQPDHAGARSAAGCARHHPARLARQDGHRALQIALRPHALLRRRLRRGHPEPEAAARSRRRPTTCARSSSATWPSAPARPARARG